MKRSTLFFMLLAFALGVGTALAQERTAGAGRVEIGAFPGGGVLFTKAANEAETELR